MSVVKNVEVKWAHVQGENEYGKYSIDAFIPKELAKEFKDSGVGGLCRDNGKSQKNEEGGILWNFKTNAVNKDGTPSTKPKVVDSDKNVLTCLIGNGSRCNIQYNIGDWTYKKKSGKSPYLQQVQVKELVEYIPKMVDEFEEEEGYTSNDAEKDEFDVEDAPGAVEIDDDDPFDD